MKKIKCIIFDLDGTLIDSGADLLDSLNYVLKKQRLPEISQKILGNLVGGGAKAMIIRGYNHLKKEVIEEELPNLIKIFLDYYFENCTKKTLLYKGVFRTLKKVKGKGYKLALCTNKKQHLTEKITKELGIHGFFDFIRGSSSHLSLKPETDMLKSCLDKLRVKPEESIMVGDSENDIIPANILNLNSVYVTYGYGKLTKKTIPTFSIEKMNDLTNLLNC